MMRRKAGKKIYALRNFAHMMETRNVQKILVRNPEGKRPLGPGHRWEDDIKMDPWEAWEDMN
jgi:hypothetical protein